MATLIYPTAFALRQIEQELLPRLEADREIFNYLPTETQDDFMLAWEQKDNYFGLQQVRGLGGEFARVKRIGAKRYQTDPGVYGEFVDLNETEMTRRRQLGTLGNPVDITDLVMDAQMQLLQRRLDRQEQIGWTLAATGTFSVASPQGGVIHTDTYPIQTASSAISWGTFATATPMADFRTVQLLGPPRGASFGAGAVAVMNRFTWNRLISNTNPNDLGGRRLAGLVPANTLEAVNVLLNGDDLAQLRVYDTGYLNDSNVFTRFVPNNKVIFFGKRAGGRRVGAYRMVRNINNPGMAPGPYMEVIQQRTPPKRVDVFDGHNGGPIIEFPGAIAVLDVT